MCAAQKMLRLCLRWVISGRARSEFIPSGLPSRADIADVFWARQLSADAVEKGLRTSPNSDSADSMDHLLGGGDDGAAE
jgi:hypothetical protein